MIEILDDEALTVSRKMRQYRGLWHFTGGWAIDLFLGVRRRRHKDVDVAVLRSEQRKLWRHLQSASPLKLLDGRLSGWQQGEWLQGEEFQVFARSDTVDASDWEFLLEDGTAAEWRYRRVPSITLARNEAYYQTGTSTPFLAPEIVLLFKAKHTMPTDAPNTIAEELGRLNDEEDFAATVPHLSAKQRQWLAASLAKTLAGHPWLDRLKSPADKSAML